MHRRGAIGEVQRRRYVEIMIRFKIIIGIIRHVGEDNVGSIVVQVDARLHREVAKLMLHHEITAQFLVLRTIMVAHEWVFHIRVANQGVNIVPGKARLPAAVEAHAEPPVLRVRKVVIDIGG